jgi:hypothetical protein
MPVLKVNTKFCIACKKNIAKSEFSSWKKNGKLYHYSYCKDCNNKKMREYQKLKSNMPIEALELYLEKFGISLLNIVKNINKERGLI